MAKKGQPVQLQAEINSDEEWEKLLQRDGLIGEHFQHTDLLRALKKVEALLIWLLYVFYSLIKTVFKQHIAFVALVTLKLVFVLLYFLYLLP